MCNAYIREVARSPSADCELPGSVTDLLLEHQVVDPTNDEAQSLA
jgi:hypothetical protein